MNLEGLRNSVVRFVGTINDRDVPGALAHGFGRKKYSSAREKEVSNIATTKMGESIDREMLTREAPAWFDISGFTQLIADISSSPVWLHLLRRTPRKVLNELKATAEVEDIEILAQWSGIWKF